MKFSSKIPPELYLIFCLILITSAIVILFLGNYIFAILALILGIVSLVAWTFVGLFEGN